MPTCPRQRQQPPPLPLPPQRRRRQRQNIPRSYSPCAISALPFLWIISRGDQQRSHAHTGYDKIVIVVVLVVTTIIIIIILFVIIIVDIYCIVVVMFRNKRKDSAIRTLVAETLVLAKTHGYVEKIEHELEEELQRENKGPPNRVFAKWRHKGEQLLKNKYTLLTVAFFCVTECALILGELILDLHKVKDVLEAQENASSTFVHSLHRLYPLEVPNTDIQIGKLFHRILTSTIQWKDPFSVGVNQSEASLQNYNETRHRRSMAGSDASIHTSQTLYITSYKSIYSSINITAHPNMTSSQRGSGVDPMTSAAGVSGTSAGGNDSDLGGSGGHSLEQEVAHALHLASITILSILVFQTILKALCAGSAFFQRKLETFDLCVVLISFVVDLVCMQIMPRYKIQDFVFILAFLLPWRVIRVVNSLVVAVQDHEHFRLKLIYGRKKKILNSLRESEVKLQLFRAQCNALKRLCYNEGIEEAKVDQILMVEECVVTKAGKSKCKVKIDNSSVIVLNDKSEFPRLSPRPSILNLFDFGARRKSMQPQSLSSNDREFFLKTSSKDSSSKKSLSFLRTRTRSNSESGRGTLSSPDESGTRQQSSLGESGISGLNTPVLIDRKSSLNSPIIASHVKHILSSLDSSAPSDNGMYRYGRGSLDEGKPPPANTTTTKNAGAVGRADSGGSSSGGVRGGGRGGSSIGASVRGDSVGSTSSGGGVNGSVPGGSGGGTTYTNGNSSGGHNNSAGPSALAALKSRRGSLQPQKRVDEDDDLTTYLHVPSSYTTTASVHHGVNATQTNSQNGHDVVVVSPENLHATSATTGATSTTTTAAATTTPNDNTNNSSNSNNGSSSSSSSSSSHQPFLSSATTTATATSANTQPTAILKPVPREAIPTSPPPPPSYSPSPSSSLRSPSTSPTSLSTNTGNGGAGGGGNSSGSGSGNGGSSGNGSGSGGCEDTRITILPDDSSSNPDDRQVLPAMRSPSPPSSSIRQDSNLSGGGHGGGGEAKEVERRGDNERRSSCGGVNPVGFKPKTVRTSSDVENENNLTATIIDMPPSSMCPPPTTTTTPPGSVGYHCLLGVRHSSITEENESPEPEREDEIMV